MSPGTDSEVKTNKPTPVSRKGLGEEESKEKDLSDFQNNSQLPLHNQDRKSMTKFL